MLKTLALQIISSSVLPLYESVEPGYSGMLYFMALLVRGSLAFHIVR
jgi:hypothetical protein